MTQTCTKLCQFLIWLSSSVFAGTDRQIDTTENNTFFASGMPGAQLTMKTAQQDDITTASIQKAQNENRKLNGNA